MQARLCRVMVDITHGRTHEASRGLSLVLDQLGVCYSYKNCPKAMESYSDLLDVYFTLNNKHNDVDLGDTAFKLFSVIENVGNCCGVKEKYKV